MQEPKRFTAKEAMHWMIDNPDKEMICDSDNPRLFRYSEIKKRMEFSHLNSPWHWLSSELQVDAWKGQFLIRSEYDAWQEALRKQESTEPKEGENLFDWLKRTKPGHWGLEDCQTWIESYVQREIRKALGGL